LEKVHKGVGVAEVGIINVGLSGFIFVEEINDNHDESSHVSFGKSVITINTVNIQIMSINIVISLHM
jgi:hypothetical protein